MINMTIMAARSRMSSGIGLNSSQHPSSIHAFGRYSQLQYSTFRSVNSNDIKEQHKYPICAQSTRGEDLGTQDSVDRFFKPGREGESRQELFDTISPVYDELNDTFSFGLHRIWKRMAVKWSGAKRGAVVLDSCCGSGDLSQILSECVGEKGKVVGLDFSQDMLRDAKMRDEQRSGGQFGRADIEWVQGDALDLPYPSEYFDAATMGYGLRNVSDIPRALEELNRVLRPGCSVAILDFNNSENMVVDGIQAFFLDSLVVPAAEAKGVGDEYRYLRPSIKKYPQGSQLEYLGYRAGFDKAKYYEIGFGLMGVLVCTKKA
jgi:demethylmenaquinone methyltransferase/2-methoxy-6-polyprenyl-1,4-benzoquinol methylase